MLHRIQAKSCLNYLLVSFLFFSVALFLLPARTVNAQALGSSRGLPGSSGGTSAIQGKVIFSGPTPTTKRVKVRLESTNFLGSTVQADEDGAFRFNGLEAGPYTITVDAGPDYDIAVENVNIDREASLGGRNLSVPIYLRPKGATAAAFAGVPQAAVDMYRKAMESSKSENTKKAVEQLNNAVTLYPNFGLAQAELGTLYLKLGQPDKAAVALQKAAELLPKDFTAHLNLGVALLNLKQFPEAEKHLREALAINSSAPTAHMYLGMALLSESRDEKTKQFYPDKYSEAQAEFETATKTGKEEVSQAHRYLGGIYWGNKEYKRAADEFEAYLKLNPKAPDAEKLKGAVKELRSKN
jgi:tetratricopeptide (TPR) repeat protein